MLVARPQFWASRAILPADISDQTGSKAQQPQIWRKKANKAQSISFQTNPLHTS